MGHRRPQASPALASPALAAAALILAAGSLAGCGDGAAAAFGFTRNNPNEFTVTTRAPLAMPATDALPAPSPGEARPQEQGARLEALETIAPDVALRGPYGPPTQGQNVLIAEAGQAASAPRHPGGELRDRAGLIDGLMFWQGRPATAIVDAKAESQRLASSAAAGQSPTAGPTPVLDPR